MKNIQDYIQQGKIYLACGDSRDEIAVELPAGGCYGRKRVYYAFARSHAAASRKLNTVDCVDKRYFAYDEDSKLFKTLSHEDYWNNDLTLDGLSETVSDTFNIEL